MNQETINEIKQANADRVSSLTNSIKELQKKGYKENFVPKYDHFVYGGDKFELYPHDLFFDEVLRFEDSSDPDGQSILFAISSPTKNIKGIYVDSYGLNHDDLSPSVIERMKFCHDLNRGALNY